MTVSNSHTHPSTTVEIVPGGPVCGSIRPPGSKSLTNRALLCAMFAKGQSTLCGALQSEDTEVMIDALRKIGVNVSSSHGGTVLVVDGVTRDKLDASEGVIDLFIANSGTTIRFLTAALSAAGGNYQLHGVPRMHERPIGDLTEAIQPILQGSIDAISPGGCPPVLIRSVGWHPGSIRVRGSVSSQYLSGLMMAAPISGQATRIEVDGELVSKPYVEMTANVMRAFGAKITSSPSTSLTTSYEIGSVGYVGTAYEIEPDASAASYFWGAAAISEGSVTVEGLSRDAMQGDVGFCEVLRKMGCDVEYQTNSITVIGKPLRGVDVDMNMISDTVQTFAVVALFADGPSRVRGVGHNRYKETDRIGDLATELRKLGAEITEHEDGMTIVPPRHPSLFQGASLATYHDHRMAMSLSLAGLRLAGVKIEDPSCTVKTYPNYFYDLEKLSGRSHRWMNA